MPKKIRELESELKRAGFVRSEGKGSHRRWSHPLGLSVFMSGNPSKDAKPYQERDVREGIEQISKGGKA